MDTLTIPTLAHIRTWCRIDDAAENSQLELLLASAIGYATRHTGLDLNASCPAGVAQAIAVMVADSYANREGQLVGSAAVDRLLAQYRTDVL